jgi:hypothetical protein
VVRAELKPEQALAIAERLKEPYSTMVLLVASLGRRIEEAMGCNRATSTKTTCCTPACGLWGKVEVLEKEQLLPPLEQRGIRFPFAFFTGFTVPLHLFPFLVRSRFFSKLFGLSVAHATPEMLVFGKRQTNHVLGSARVLC